MLQRFRRSIQFKMLGFLGVALLGTLVITSLINWAMLRHSLQDQVAQTALKVTGPSQATLIKNLMPTGNTPLVQHTLKSMVNDSVKGITVYRTDGRATFASDEGKRYEFTKDPALLSILAQKEPQTRWGQADGEPAVLTYYPIKATEVCARCHIGVKPGDIRGFIELKTSLHDVNAALGRQSVLNALFQVLIFIGLLGVMGLILARTVTHPLGRLTEVAKGIAAGRLDQEVDLQGEDEMGQLAEGLRGMIRSLKGVVTRVRAAAQVVETGVEQISSSTEQMARTSQSQASVTTESTELMGRMARKIDQVAGNAQALADNVDTTSSSIEEMAASIQQVAGHAETLAQAVGETSAAVEEMAGSIQEVAGSATEATRAAEASATVADEGREAVRQTIEGMARIDGLMAEVVGVIRTLGDRSHEIGAIVEVIEDIAEQTNLLALNAAIEAARAGDAGRGFAVVADEVRKLAERSAKATGEISGIIRGIRTETERAIASSEQGTRATREGDQLARRAGEALETIVASAGQASAQMAQIAQAAQAQARSADQITGAVARMSELTQHVTQSTREQAKGSELIIGAVEAMNRMTAQVSQAAVEQRQGGEQMVQAIEQIRQSSEEAVGGTGLIAAAVLDLQRQAQALLELIAFFRLQDEAFDPTPSSSVAIVRVVEATQVAGGQNG